MDLFDTFYDSSKRVRFSVLQNMTRLFEALSKPFKTLKTLPNQVNTGSVVYMDMYKTHQNNFKLVQDSFTLFKISFRLGEKA